MKLLSYGAKLAPIKTLYESYCPPDQRCFSLRGSLSAKVVTIIGSLSEEDQAKGRILHNPAAEWLEGMLEEAGLQIMDDFFHIPLITHGTKPLKHNTQHLAAIVQMLRDSHEKFNVKLLVGIGSDSHRFMFHGGIKTSVATMLGRKVFMPHRLGHLPLFMLPCYLGVIPAIATTARDAKWNEFQAERNRDMLKACAKTLVELLKSHE